jgi:hypothetical protein
MTKSETRTIQGQPVLGYSVCQAASPRENDFASSVARDEADEMRLCRRGIRLLGGCRTAPWGEAIGARTRVGCRRAIPPRACAMAGKNVCGQHEVLVLLRRLDM